MNPRDPFDRADLPAVEPWRRPAPTTSPVAPGMSWSSGAEPSPAPTPATDATARTDVIAAPRRTGRRTIGPVLGAALLSALLASGSTFAVVGLATPHGSPAAAAPAAAANTTASGGAQTTVQQE